MDNFKELFQNPTNEYRGKPFWSWNGRLDKDELLRQIHIMKEMGFGGFFMHSRVGLATEYLGDEWFSLINACTEEAEKLGMEAWLYDEDRWPSGTAGGMVTVKSKNRMKFIRMNIDQFKWNDDVICAFSCDLDSINFSNAVKLKYGELAYDKSIVWFDIVEMPKSNFYNGYTYADTMNKDTTHDFLNSTHEKYKTHCANQFGKVIKGIFTDEPHRGNVMSISMHEGYSAPWTYTLFDEYQKRWGYDLKDHLLHLFLRKDGEAVSQVKWHYMELLQQLFLENWAMPIHQWCSENNLILTGHVLHEDTLSAQAAMQGSLMRFYEHMDFPGVDLLTEFNKSYCIVKQLSSAARQLGQKWLLSELYGCTGWQLNFESHKAVGDWQALLGINLRCHHLSWYTMEGEAKRDYPASILHQSAWHTEYKLIEDYFSRIGLFMQQGTPVCDYVVINPIESVWCQIHAKWVNFVSSKSSQIDKIEEQYKKLYTWLLEAKIDYDIADEEMLSRLYSTQIVNDTPIFVIGSAKYKKVIVSGLVTIRSTTLAALKEFIALGGEVIFLGDAPNYVDAVKCDEAVTLSLNAVSIPFSKETLNGLEKVKLVEVTDSLGANIDDIFVQIRLDEKLNTYIMLLNTNRKQAFKANVKIRRSGNLYEWNAKDGTCSAIQQNDDEMNTIVEFAPCQEKLYMITSDDELVCEQEKTRTIKASYKLGNPIGYQLLEPNICVLDMAKCTLDGIQLELQEILKIDIALRKKYSLGLRGGEMLQPWFVDQKEHQALGNIRLTFEFYVKDMPNEDIILVVENPEKYLIKINGVIINETKGKWIDICFTKLYLKKEFLMKGPNEITMEAEFKEDYNLEAIYLLGNFGVQLDGCKKTLTKLPQLIGYGELKNQGLPFYSGKIKYLFDNPVNEPSQICFSSLCGAACIKVGGEMIAWQPYKADVQQSKEISVVLVLTRRNTFGPLHEKNLNANAYGPPNFIRSGEYFSEDYMLIPTGIIEVPTIEVFY